MARSLTKEEVFGLTVDERLELIETLWDSIAPQDVAVPESHKRALDDAMADYSDDSKSGRSWHSVRDDLFRK